MVTSLASSSEVVNAMTKKLNCFFFLLLATWTYISAEKCIYQRLNKTTQVSPCGQAINLIYRDGWQVDKVETIKINRWANNSLLLLYNLRRGVGDCVMYKMIHENVEDCCSGWTGELCETPICSQSCVHGTCSSPGTCSCSGNWTGLSCDEDLKAVNETWRYCYSEKHCKGEKQYNYLVTKEYCCSNWENTSWGYHGTSGSDGSCFTCKKDLTPANTVIKTSLVPFRTCVSGLECTVRTFDGVVYKFCTDCTLTLVRTMDIVVTTTTECESNVSPLCYKVVRIESLHNRRRYVLTSDKVVMYEVDQGELLQSIHLGEIHEHAVQLGEISVDLVGDSVFVTISEYDIRVRRDNNIQVLVTIGTGSPLRKNKIDGACGNFDEDIKDEMQLASDEHRVKRFIVRPTGQACGQGRKVCKTEEKKAAAHLACSVLSSMLFKGCHTLVDVRPYVQSCVESFCSAEGEDPKVLEEARCKAIGAYANTCAMSGVVIQWATDKLCPRQCPNNMIYRQCGPSCKPTCGHPLGIYLRDECSICCPGCHCEDGLVLFNGTCIQPTQCPCSYKDQAYEYGHTLYIKEACEICTCGHFGHWNCTATPCRATCSVYGPGVMTTFDGEEFVLGTQGGNCNYTLVTALKSYLQIKLLARPCGVTPGAVCANGFELNLETHSIVVQLSESGGFQLLDAMTKVLQEIPHYRRDIYIRQATSSSIIADFKGFRIIFQAQGVLAISTEESLYFGIIRGLCGNLNNFIPDDRLLVSGVAALGDSEFASAFSDDKCGTIQSLSQTSVNLPQCTALRRLYAQFNQTEDTAERAYRVCMYHGETASVCSAILLLATTIEVPLSTLLQYSYEEFDVLQVCNEKLITCEEGLEYHENIDVCKSNCLDLPLDKASCQPKTIQGCTCGEGFYRNHNDSCVARSQCPCFHAQTGQYHQPGPIHGIPCRECRCENGKLRCIEKGCEEIVCPRDQVVFTTDINSKECHHYKCPDKYSNQITCDDRGLQMRKCVCPDGYLMTVTGTCTPQDLCPCYHDRIWHSNGTDITDTCYHKRCNNGVWDVLEKSRCHARCYIAGAESRLETFDGTSFSFQGTGTYTLVKTLGDAEGFKISFRNLACEGSDLPCSHKIDIYFLGIHVELVSGVGVKVGNKTFSQEDSVTIRDIKITFTTLYTAVNFENVTVFWSGGLLTWIQVSTRWINKLEGLCGTYDYRSKNDVTKSDGSQATDIFDLINSWQEEDIIGKGVIKLRSPCENVPEKKIWAQTQCSVIESARVFQPCRDVLTRSHIDRFKSDCERAACYCKGGGDSECFCSALAHFAAVCDSLGYPVQWRSQQLCPAQCEGGKVYGYSERPCQRTCFDLANNITHCDVSGTVEGCYCTTDEVWHESRCIPSSECPCYDGQYFYEPGTVVRKDCTLCVCESGKFTCKATKCPDCSDKEFKCVTSGLCIPMSNVCNNFLDCYDGSDESPSLCEAKNCTGLQFQCKIDGKCIHSSQLCDGVAHCTDGSDEDKEECKTDCDFHCKNGQCLNKIFLCDGFGDCFDGDDEIDCEQECGLGYFRCNNTRKCIKNDHLCDGHDDCGDGTDEIGCISFALHMPSAASSFGIMETSSGISTERISTETSHPVTTRLEASTKAETETSTTVMQSPEITNIKIWTNGTSTGTSTVEIISTENMTTKAEKTAQIGTKIMHTSLENQITEKISLETTIPATQTNFETSSSDLSTENVKKQKETPTSFSIHETSVNEQTSPQTSSTITEAKTSAQAEAVRFGTSSSETSLKISTQNTTSLETSSHQTTSHETSSHQAKTHKPTQRTTSYETSSHKTTGHETSTYQTTSHEHTLQTTSHKTPAHEITGHEPTLQTISHETSAHEVSIHGPTHQTTSHETSSYQTTGHKTSTYQTTHEPTLQITSHETSAHETTTHEPTLQTTSYEVSAHETTTHEPKHQTTSHETSSHQAMTHKSTLQTTSHETFARKISTNEPTPQVTSHETSAHETTTHEPTHQTTSHKTLPHQTTGLGTSTYQTTGHETSTYQTTGHETSTHQTTGYETSGQQTTSHETSSQETTSHETSTQKIVTHKASAEQITSHETSIQQTTSNEAILATEKVSKGTVYEMAGTETTEKTSTIFEVKTRKKSAENTEILAASTKGTGAETFEAIITEISTSVKTSNQISSSNATFPESSTSSQITTTQTTFTTPPVTSAKTTPETSAVVQTTTEVFTSTQATSETLVSPHKTHNASTLVEKLTTDQNHTAVPTSKETHGTPKTSTVVMTSTEAFTSTQTATGTATATHITTVAYEEEEVEKDITAETFISAQTTSAQENTETSTSTSELCETSTAGEIRATVPKSAITTSETSTPTLIISETSTSAQQTTETYSSVQPVSRTSTSVQTTSETSAPNLTISTTTETYSSVQPASRTSISVQTTSEKSTSTLIISETSTPAQQTNETYSSAQPASRTSTSVQTASETYAPTLTISTTTETYSSVQPPSRTSTSVQTTSETSTPTLIISETSTSAQQTTETYSSAQPASKTSTSVQETSETSTPTLTISDTSTSAQQTNETYSSAQPASRTSISVQTTSETSTSAQQTTETYSSVQPVSKTSTSVQTTSETSAPILTISTTTETYSSVQPVSRTSTSVQTTSETSTPTLIISETSTSAQQTTETYSSAQPVSRTSTSVQTTSETSAPTLTISETSTSAQQTTETYSSAQSVSKTSTSVQTTSETSAPTLTILTTTETYSSAQPISRISTSIQTTSETSAPTLTISETSASAQQTNETYSSAQPASKTSTSVQTTSETSAPTLTISETSTSAQQTNETYSSAQPASRTSTSVQTTSETSTSTQQTTETYSSVQPVSKTSTSVQTTSETSAPTLTNSTTTETYSSAQPVSRISTSIQTTSETSTPTLTISETSTSAQQTTETYSSVKPASRTSTSVQTTSETSAPTLTISETSTSAQKNIEIPTLDQTSESSILADITPEKSISPQITTEIPISSQTTESSTRPVITTESSTRPVITTETSILAQTTTNERFTSQASPSTSTLSQTTSKITSLETGTEKSSETITETSLSDKKKSETSISAHMTSETASSVQTSIEIPTSTQTDTVAPVSHNISTKASMSTHTVTSEISSVKISTEISGSAQTATGTSVSENIKPETSASTHSTTSKLAAEMSEILTPTWLSSEASKFPETSSGTFKPTEISSTGTKSEKFRPTETISETFASAPMSSEIYTSIQTTEIFGSSEMSTSTSTLSETSSTALTTSETTTETAPETSTVYLTNETSTISQTSPEIPTANQIIMVPSLAETSRSSESIHSETLTSPQTKAETLTSAQTNAETLTSAQINIETLRSIQTTSGAETIPHTTSEQFTSAQTAIGPFIIAETVTKTSQATDTGPETSVPSHHTSPESTTPWSETSFSKKDHQETENMTRETWHFSTSHWQTRSNECPQDCLTSWSCWSACPRPCRGIRVRVRGYDTENTSCLCGNEILRQAESCVCNYTSSYVPTMPSAQQCDCAPPLECAFCFDECHQSCRAFRTNAVCHERDYCSHGCKCPHGQLMDDDRFCTPPSNCPCYDTKGIEVPFNATYIDPTTCQICVCSEEGSICKDRENEFELFFEWSDWSHWSACSSHCGNGTSFRYRTGNYHGCITTEEEYKPCSSEECLCVTETGEMIKEGQTYNPNLCLTCKCAGGEFTCVTIPESVVDGKWEPWGEWTPCVQNCINYHQSQSRYCRPPVCGGRPCEGPGVRTRVCSEAPCCHIYRWSDWTDCNQTCGSQPGYRTRHKIYADELTTTRCGEFYENEKCGLCQCNEKDGLNTSFWSEWTPCSNEGAICGWGKRYRYRSTSDQCAESRVDSTQMENCFLGPCNCRDVLVWSNHSLCERTCKKEPPGACSLIVSGGCVCPSHLVSTGQECIPLEQCSNECVYKNKTYQEGQSFHCDYCKTCQCCRGNIYSEKIKCPNVRKCNLKTHQLVPSEDGCCLVDCVPKEICRVQKGEAKYITKGDCTSVEKVDQNFCTGPCPTHSQLTDYTGKQIGPLECLACSAKITLHKSIEFKCENQTSYKHLVPFIADCHCK